MSRRKALAVLVALLLLLLGLRIVGPRWLGARGGSGAGGEGGGGKASTLAGGGEGRGDYGGRGRWPGLKETAWWKWFFDKDGRQPLFAPRGEASPALEAPGAAAPPPSSSAAGTAAESRRPTSGLDFVYGTKSVGTLTSPAAPSGLAEIRAAPLAGHRPAGGDPPPRSRPFEGPKDTAPAPNPQRPRTPEGPCPKPGWWKNNYTGLCYLTRQSCAGADYAHEGCFQPNP